MAGPCGSGALSAAARPPGVCRTLGELSGLDTGSLLRVQDHRLHPGSQRGPHGARAAPVDAWGPIPLPEVKETRLRLFSPSFYVVEKCAL